MQQRCRFSPQASVRLGGARTSCPATPALISPSETCLACVGVGSVVWLRSLVSEDLTRSLFFRGPKASCGFLKLTMRCMDRASSAATAGERAVRGGLNGNGKKTINFSSVASSWVQGVAPKRGSKAACFGQTGRAVVPVLPGPTGHQLSAA